MVTLGRLSFLVICAFLLTHTKLHNAALPSVRCLCLRVTEAVSSTKKPSESLAIIDR